MAAFDPEDFTYQRLSRAERAIAWAVVRSIATALWVSVAIMGALWVLIAAIKGRVDLWWLLPLVGAAGLAGAMEVKSRGLQKPVA